MKTEDEIKIRKAIIFVNKKNHGIKRDDGHDVYKGHLKPVAKALNIFIYDIDVIVAAILHDTLEDTDTTKEELITTFGERVAELVHMVTHEGKKDSHGYYFPRLTPEYNKELYPLAVAIKLADRLSNVTSMGSWSQKKQDHFLKRTVFWKTNL